MKDWILDELFFFGARPSCAKRPVGFSTKLTFSFA